MRITRGPPPRSLWLKEVSTLPGGFPGAPVVKHMPAQCLSCGFDPFSVGSIHMLWRNEVCQAQLLKPTCLRACALRQEALKWWKPWAISQAEQPPLLHQRALGWQRRSLGGNEDPLQPKIRTKVNKYRLSGEGFYCWAEKDIGGHPKPTFVLMATSWSCPSPHTMDCSLPSS